MSKSTARWSSLSPSLTAAHSGCRHCQVQLKYLILTPWSNDMILVDNVALQVTLVISVFLSVRVIISGKMLQMLGVVVGKMTPLIALKLTVGSSPAMVTEHSQPASIGQLEESGLIWLHTWERSKQMGQRQYRVPTNRWVNKSELETDPH